MSEAFDKSLVPVLRESASKGSFGRVVVVGGCAEYDPCALIPALTSYRYTGAPFYAAMAALKTGSDLAYVICSEEAAMPIKSYSPELIVYPMLSQLNETMLDFVLSRAHVLVIGPGLGRSEVIMQSAETILKKAQSLGVACILDGDGIYMLSLKPAILSAPTHIILTPNRREFELLCGLHNIDADSSSSLRDLSLSLPGMTIVLKGATDHAMLDGQGSTCTEEGSPRRCGGQGDILAGILATFLHWDSLVSPGKPSKIKASINACILLRISAKLAFKKSHRGTLASDILEMVPMSLQGLL